jgi:hypothetical protein
LGAELSTTAALQGTGLAKFAENMRELEFEWQIFSLPNRASRVLMFLSPEEYSCLAL